MKLHRIQAVVVRHLYNFKHNWDRVSDCVYWPIMDMLVWGLTTKWLQNSPDAPPNVLLIMLTAIVFWQIVWRANYEVAVNLLEETWQQNLVNLFSTPLKLSEWLAGVMVVGVIKVAFAIVIGFTASWVLYSLNILKVGYAMVPFLASLILFGWTLGFIASGLIVRFGRQIQAIAWMIGFLFAPLSAVYYPVSVLPPWLQTVAYWLPTTYVFEGMRGVLSAGSLSLSMLLKSFLLNVVYLTAALWFFAAMFRHRLNEGLARLE